MAQTGASFEIIVVDDDSSDRTREIAQTFAKVILIAAEPFSHDSHAAGAHGVSDPTGKNNAIITGVREARGDWLLFTDADTVHLPGSLARALDEAKKEGADLLSYSPEQVVVTLAERAVMPVIFSELAARYPLHKVRDQNSEIVAANGQYILVGRAAYEAVGGHAAVAAEILEDVALARRFRDAGFRVYFRYGSDAVRARMYRNWPQLREGWTKNLAQLFPEAKSLALLSLLVWWVAWSSLGIAVAAIAAGHLLPIAFVFFWIVAYRRISVAHFIVINNIIAMALGLPLFAYLLFRSQDAHKRGQVAWKGRTYKLGGDKENARHLIEASSPGPGAETKRLQTEN
jgi:glycosyltransferase involved in cell wall biosynthesis